MLGTKIKEYITESGLKFSAVAEKSGISANTFSAIVNEKRKITAEEYFSVCQTLGVPLEQFYTYDGKP